MKKKNQQRTFVFTFLPDFCYKHDGEKNKKGFNSKDILKPVYKEV